MEPGPAAHELSDPDEGAVLVGFPREALTAELLGLCDEFFRHASPTVHTELRQFLGVGRNTPERGRGAAGPG